MIVLTEEELENVSLIIMKKIDKDKRFDRYTDGEIITILGHVIMRIGRNIAINDMEEMSEEMDNNQREAS